MTSCKVQQVQAAQRKLLPARADLPVPILVRAKKPEGQRMCRQRIRMELDTRPPAVRERAKLS